MRVAHAASFFFSLCEMSSMRNPYIFFCLPFHNILKRGNKPFIPIPQPIYFISRLNVFHCIIPTSFISRRYSSRLNSYTQMVICRVLNHRYCSAALLPIESTIEILLNPSRSKTPSVFDRFIIQYSIFHTSIFPSFHSSIFP